MSPARTSSPQPQLRAADADRDTTLAELSDHFQAGRLTLQEFDERSAQALTARTMGDLDGLMADLPAGAEPVPATAAAPATARAGLSRLAAALVVIAGLAALASVVLTGSHHHGWTAWWIIPVALVAARRIARRPRLAGPRGYRRGWHEDHGPEESDHGGW